MNKYGVEKNGGKLSVSVFYPINGAEVVVGGGLWAVPDSGEAGSAGLTPRYFRLDVARQLQWHWGPEPL